MDIYQIKADLKSSDSQARMRALTALRGYDSEVAVPLLKTKLRDPEFLVRSFVAMGLGRKQTPEAFDALVDLVKHDNDYNVRAEAANSLSLYGEAAVPYLLQVFRANAHWLIRRSILAAFIEMPYPDILLEVCIEALADSDLTVQEGAVDGFGSLAGKTEQAAGLQQLLMLVSSDEWRIRVRVARVLRRFDDADARDALSRLRVDQDHRVVAAVLEGLL
ncbi:HEAT repeat domain-containing protein [Microcoleus sp. FACHB-68]|uniref:HEAT repeat domain-containing protein n=1 Tax=Microcoleus sp. FACHB-68 TaxID=2692826 RepID=UPI0016838E7E|nr:HEAT repeat domain-containing protein [Microcoleus sp. FACHB-68]MBD1939445.1 HEAT repeat domain-containing protein [Microcoleus sp. FACHB-68]